MGLPSSPVRSTGGSHVPALDGIRGVAILLVLAAHSVANLPFAGVTLVPAALASFGWAGVDLFFVLSGWLITGILLDGGDGPGARRAFYFRRALRIWPLYVLLLTILSTLAWGWPALAPEDAAAFRENAPWYWTHTYNWFLVHVAGTDATFVDAYGTGPLWSLAIEEQFYLVWPVIVAAVVAWRGLRALAWVCAGLALASGVLRVGLLAAGVPLDALTVMPFTRLEGLAIGSGLAAAARVPAAGEVLRARTAWLAARPQWAILGALAVHAASLWARALGGRPMIEVVGVPLATAWFGAVLVAAVAHGPDTALARALSGRLLRGAGRISYGLYVWHTPAVYFVGRAVQARFPGGGEITAYVASYTVAVGVALLSWYAWERPWLSLRRLAPRPAVAPMRDAPVAAAPTGRSA